MTSKHKKDQGKSDDEPKRHIVLPEKRKIIGVEDISDKSEDFDQFDDCPPLSVDVDTQHPVVQKGRSLLTLRS